MKKVLFVLDHEFPSDIRVENEIEILNEMGVSVHLLVLTRKNQIEYERISPMLHIYRKPMSDFIYKSSVAILKFPFYFNFWWSFVKEVFDKESFDGIHIHDLPLAKIGVKASLKYNIPVVLDLHENWPYLVKDAKHTRTFIGRLLSSNKQWIKYEKSMANQSTYIITVVDEMKSRITNLGVDKNKIYTYQNVPNLNRLDQNLEKIQTDNFEIIYAGGITEARGLQVVCEGIKKLQGKIPNLKFKILGDGSYLPILKLLVKSLSIERYVEFKGKVSQIEVMKSLTTANVCIIPHLRSVQNDHSSPNKIYQYMLSKTAVLSSDCMSLKRLIKETKIGLTYSDKEPEDFATKLFWLYEHPEKTIEFGLNGSKAVFEKYNTEIEAKELIKLYEKI